MTNSAIASIAQFKRNVTHKIFLNPFLIILFVDVFILITNYIIFVFNEKNIIKYFQMSWDMCNCPKKGIDYYGVLEIKKNSEDSDIKKAYRRLAICHNPGRTNRSESSRVIFYLIAEAYDVLSDPFKRTVYDQFGEEGLKSGVPGTDDYIQPYVYHGEPMRTYREFFGTESPYADLLDILSKPSDFDDCPEGRGARRKEEPIYQSLPLTLSEVFYGGLKKMKIQKLVFANEEKVDTVLSEKVLDISIKPGLPTGTKIVFAEEGDQGPSKIPADIIFVTEDQPHETFNRECANLSMMVKIFLCEALVGTVVIVKTIDERILRVPITSIVTPDYEKLVKNEGLPVFENPEKRGDLIIKFDIEFPVYMPITSKNYVKKAFGYHRRNHGINDEKEHRNVDDGVLMRRDKNEHEKWKLFCNS